MNFHFLGLGPKLEIEQASQPLALLCPLNLARKDKEWTKVGSKMEVQSWQLHCRILCEMALNQTFEGGAQLGGKKVQA